MCERGVGGESVCRIRFFLLMCVAMCVEGMHRSLSGPALRAEQHSRPLSASVSVSVSVSVIVFVSMVVSVTSVEFFSKNVHVNVYVNVCAGVRPPLQGQDSKWNPTRPILRSVPA